MVWSVSKFQILRHDIAKNYKRNRIMLRMRPKEFSVRLVSTKSIPTRLISTMKTYRAAPFSFQGTLLHRSKGLSSREVIIFEYLKPTIEDYSGANLFSCSKRNCSLGIGLEFVKFNLKFIHHSVIWQGVEKLNWCRRTFCFLQIIFT